MSELILHLEGREERKKENQALRQEGYVPVVLYGRGLENLHLKVRSQEFKTVFSEAGQSALIDLILPGEKKVKGLVQDVQWDPLSSQVQHVDLHQVRMDEKLHTEIPLRFDGIAPAVKELGGTLVKSIEHLKVECLPDALVPELSIDVSALKTFEDHLTIKDVPHPDGIQFLHEEQEVVALVAAPQKEEEPVPASTETSPETTGTAGETTGGAAGSENGSSEKKPEKKEREK